MKRTLIFSLLITFLLMFNLSVQAQVDYKAQYEEAKALYATANACLAAYDDRVGNMFYTFLQYDGWQAERIKKTGDVADTNVFVAKRHDETTCKTTYILSFRGTASRKDINIDRRTGRVLFQGSSIEEITANAHKEEIPDTQPKVHRGFLQYTLAAFNVDLENSSIVTGSNHLHDVIKENPDSELVVTGHSLGGAAAVLYAATIINLGVPEEQIQVVTFGAPAVGNKAFADEYADKIDMLRIYSPFDPVPGGLQSIHSYVQFGTPMTVKSDPRLRVMQHSMENYADLMGKHYYDCKEEAIHQGVIPADANVYDEGSGEIVAVAVLAPDTDYQITDFKYARENLLDIYRASFLRYRLLDVKNPEVTMLELEEMARKVGADYILAARIGMSRVRVSKNWVVDLSQGVFNARDGALFSGLAHSVRIGYGDSLFQASAYNGFRAVEDLSARGAKWVRPLAYQLAE